MNNQGEEAFETQLPGTNLERPVLDVALHGLVVEVASDETLRIEDGVLGIDGQLVLGGISDQTLAVLTGERDVRRGDTVS